MITLSAVNLGYEKPLLENISFSAESGKITVILGINGCGKSTLLRAISGNFPYTGSIKVNGHEISAATATERARLISVMPQSQSAPDITVRELVSYGRQPYAGLFGILSKNDREIINSALKRTDMLSLSESLISRISGGERQRAYFAMILAQDTDNVLLDEPGAHLDANHNRSLKEFMIEMSENGKTVISVMHDINRAIEIADRIIFINEKSLVFNGDPNDFQLCDIPESLLGLKAFECNDGTLFRKFFL